jgi:hypothetical protein
LFEFFIYLLFIIIVNIFIECVAESNKPFV